MDRKLISVALIASALVLVSMVSVGLSYSSVHVTEENTCTITCTYGYGETTVSGVGVKSGGSDLTFTPGDTNILEVTYNDTQDNGRVGINIYLEDSSGSLNNQVWTVKLGISKGTDGKINDPNAQTGYASVKDGKASIYGFHLDLGNEEKSKTFYIESGMSANNTTGNPIPLKLTIKAIREAV